MRKKVITLIVLLAGLSLLAIGLTISQFSLIATWYTRMRSGS